MAATGIIPTVDYVIKRLFGTDENKALLIHFLNAILATVMRRRIVAIDPFDSKAQTSLGRLLLQRKDVTAALRAFKSALATKPPERLDEEVMHVVGMDAAGHRPFHLLTELLHLVDVHSLLDQGPLVE